MKTHNWENYTHGIWKFAIWDIWNLERTWNIETSGHLKLENSNVAPRKFGRLDFRRNANVEFAYWEIGHL